MYLSLKKEKRKTHDSRVNYSRKIIHFLFIISDTII